MMPLQTTRTHMIEISTKRECELSDGELEAASGGFIGETVRNDSPPPSNRSEERLASDHGQSGRATIGKT
jgi:hypothetical protein